MKVEQMDALLKKSLPLKRYQHSVNVMYEAVLLGSYYQLDERKVRIAALLHDCGREIPTSQAVTHASELGIELNFIEVSQPVLIHAKLGKVLAQKKYEVQDQDILRAIELHTTGGIKMSTLDKVIFLADLIEPERTQKNVQKIRRLVRRDLNLAMQEAIKSNLFYLMREGRYVHPDCLVCWNYLLQEAAGGVKST